MRFRSSLGRVAGGLALFLVYLGSASAAFCPASVPIVLGVRAFAFSQTVGEGGGTDDQGCISGAPEPLAGVTNSAATLNSTATATTFFGLNSAFISGTTTDSAPASSAIATSVWADSILITGGTGTGIVTFGERVTGSFTEGAGGGAGLEIDTGDPNQGFIGVGTELLVCQAGCDGQTFFVDRRLELRFEFTYGVAFKLQGALEVSGGGNFVGPYKADFASTAILDTVILPDGAILTSGSGTIYPIQIRSVAEPGVLALLFASLPVAFLMSSLRSRTGSSWRPCRSQIRGNRRREATARAA